MSSEPPRRGREPGVGSSPVASTAAIIIAVIAVVGGFFILKQINDDDDGSGGTVTPGTSVTPTTSAGGVTSTSVGDGTTLPGQTTTPTSAATPTTLAPVTTGATVAVANASTVNGAAGQFTTALQGKGFTMSDATNANIKLPVSVVYYADGDASAQAVATYLSSLLGGISVEPMPTPPPVQGGSLPDGVTVLLMVGSDKAGKTLDEAAQATPTTAGAATSAPATTTG